MAADKKGITVKVDADLHAEIREYLDAHQMTMAEFISLAVEDELHPKYQEKEENTMEKMSEAESRRQDCCRDGLPGSRYRRDHRRLSA